MKPKNKPDRCPPQETEDGEEEENENARPGRKSGCERDHRQPQSGDSEIEILVLPGIVRWEGFEPVDVRLSEWIPG